eukprot:251004-Prymnesium_polylepis.1
MISVFAATLSTPCDSIRAAYRTSGCCDNNNPNAQTCHSHVNVHVDQMLSDVFAHLSSNSM